MVTSICMTVEFLTQNSYPSTLCFAIMTMQHIKKNLYSHIWSSATCGASSRKRESKKYTRNCFYGSKGI